jgi:hypothetical protein
MKMGNTTRPLGRPLLRGEGEVRVDLVSTRQFATAAGDLHLRMRPEVQVLPGPPPAPTSGNASQRFRSPLGRACTGSRTLTWLPFLVMDVSLQVSAQTRCVPHGQRERPERAIDDLLGRSHQPDPCWAAHHRGDRERHGGGCADRCALRGAAPRPCQSPPPGVRWACTMRLRLGRARLLGGLVGAWQPGQGR